MVTEPVFLSGKFPEQRELKEPKLSKLPTSVTSLLKDRTYNEIHHFRVILIVYRTGWAALAAENAGCSTSTQQSPIDITATSAQVVAPGTLQLNFPAVESAEFENIGTTLEVVMEGKNASTTVGGKV